MGGNKSLIREIFEFLIKRKKWWLLPLVIMIILALSLVFLLSSPAVSSFVYALV